MNTTYTIRRTKFQGRPAELLTFTGETAEEYDAFLDARFAPDREAIGWRTDSAAPAKMFDWNYGRIVWLQFRRFVVS